MKRAAAADAALFIPHGRGKITIQGGKNHEN